MKKLLLSIAVFSSMLFNAQTVVLDDFASNLTAPVEITHAGDARLFVVQQSGAIKIVQPNGTVNATDFLNITSKILFSGERGFLGLAFHPQYATNGYFFIYYNQVTTGNIIVARYSRSAGNPDVADGSSEKILLNIPKPFPNHNGGSMHFAPDGNLWISTGDGGSSGDPNNNSQNKNSLLGKMLRIDVNATGPYNIPAGNPFIGIDGADEIWSYGLRNAWKFNFDTTAGNVMIADVGQNQFEEINRNPITTAGINYGWRCFEGNTSYNATGCAPSTTMTFPVAVYDRSNGKCSVTGGYVYRGSLYPAFSGKYLMADYCSRQIGILNADNSITWSAAFAGNNFSTFGEDINKELYVAAVNNGKIYKLRTTSLGTENSNISQLSISPNPASGKAFVKGLKTKNNTIEINSADGRRLNEIAVADDGSFDVSKLKSGVYFLNVKSDNLKMYSTKLVIK